MNNNFVVVCLFCGNFYNHSNGITLKSLFLAILSSKILQWFKNKARKHTQTPGSPLANYCSLWHSKDWDQRRGLKMRSVHENGEENNKLKSPNQSFLWNKTHVCLPLLLFWETQNPWAREAFPLSWSWVIPTESSGNTPPIVITLQFGEPDTLHGGKLWQSLGFCSQLLLTLIILREEACSFQPNRQPWCGL